jgi:predicted DNA-binding protein YlxM (UPF0122 family)
MGKLIKQGGNNAVQNAEFITNNRRNTVANMYLKGYSYQKMANELGVSKSTIHADIQAITEIWAKENLDVVANAKDVQLKKLDNLENELWLAYDYSKKDTVKVTKTLQHIKDKSSDDKETIPMEIIKTEVTKNVGDPTILAKILNVVEQRSRILGLYTINIKSNVEHTNNFDSMSVEQLLAFLNQKTEGQLSIGNENIE